MVFDNLDWSLPRGARVRIIGASGAGGTAILRLAAGLAHPERGVVRLEGLPHAPDRFDHPSLRRGAVAWIPQEGGLVSNLTLIQNVALPLRFVQGMRREEARRIARAMLERLELAEHAELRPHALLRGERQLGALARSSVADAELWLLDRPFDDLDARGLDLATGLVEGALEDAGRSMVMVGDGPPYESLHLTSVRLEGGRLSTGDNR